MAMLMAMPMSLVDLREQCIIDDKTVWENSFEGISYHSCGRQCVISQPYHGYTNGTTSINVLSLCLTTFLLLVRYKAF